MQQRLSGWCFYFFFSSRRRHTRCLSDWSSDVCSSDLNYVLNSEKWNKDPFFKTFVVNYTNAATIISEDFKDTEDLDGVFSGLLQSKSEIGRASCRERV